MFPIISLNVIAYIYSFYSYKPCSFSQLIYCEHFQFLLLLIIRLFWVIIHYHVHLPTHRYILHYTTLNGTNTYIHTLPHTHTYIHKYTHTYIHIHIPLTHIRTHTYIQYIDLHMHHAICTTHLHHKSYFHTQALPRHPNVRSRRVAGPGNSFAF